MLMGDDRAGELIEIRPDGKDFLHAQTDTRTEDYINGLWLAVTKKRARAVPSVIKQDEKRDSGV